jgi:4-hydroxybenzoate polyprenyltransferase
MESTRQKSQTFWQWVVNCVASFAELTTFSHSVFALPFALALGVIVAPGAFHESLAVWFWIVVCVVLARSSAMAFNRAADAAFDASNPRTAQRPVPRGVWSQAEAFTLAVVTAAGFVAASSLVGPHCVLLSPLVVVVLWGYSLLKRFTSWCHVGLGIALALAPGGVWYAFRGTIEWAPVPFMTGVALWVAGFDIIYAGQDEEFDRGSGLHSIPARCGYRRALTISRILHTGSVMAFALFGVTTVGISNWGYWIGLVIFSLCLIFQQMKVERFGVSGANGAFFVFNAWASVGFFTAILFGRIALSE